MYAIEIKSDTSAQLSVQLTIINPPPHPPHPTPPHPEINNNIDVEYRDVTSELTYSLLNVSLEIYIIEL